ncbi:MAG: hypothetical protein HKN13_08605, partial [Rhodothermales bacterium]|nr:hypothetical protein [Rhodothermales bacterium]
MKRFYFVLIPLFLCAQAAVAQNLRVNEALSSNSSTFVDEDGESVDWIELFNGSSSSVQLQGYGITDDPTNRFKWVMPYLELEPGGFSVLFASGKDRRGLDGRWETIVAPGDLWQYTPGTTSIDASWINNGFDDSSWSTGPAGIGYGDGDDATQTGAITSLFARHTFSVSDTSALISASLHMDYDD